MPKEPMKKVSFRLPPTLWQRAKDRADDKGETVSEAVRKFLDAYAEGTTEAMRRFVKGINR